MLNMYNISYGLWKEFYSLNLFIWTDNFQDQMKRELAYREEMVQQLQMVRDTNILGYRKHFVKNAFDQLNICHKKTIPMDAP